MQRAPALLACLMFMTPSGLAKAQDISLSAEASGLAIFDGNQGSDIEYSGTLGLDAGWASIDIKPVYVETDFYKSFAVQGQITVPFTEFGTFLMIAGNYENDRQDGVFDIDYRDIYAGIGQYLLFDHLGPFDRVTGYVEGGFGRMDSRLKFGPIHDRIDEASWAYLSGADVAIDRWTLSAQISQRFADRDGQRQRLEHNSV